MRWLVAVATLSGCLSSNSVVCDDGTACPSGTVCVASICATADQVKACAGKADLDVCGDHLQCYSGVCLPGGCGNGHLDPGELCDDGDTAADDGCSPDCLSDETCGNGIVDAVKRETCDDRNFVDHDGCTSACKVEAPHWIRHTSEPGSHWEHRAAYDPLRHRLVVFGGVAEPNMSGPGEARVDTWEWDGASWTRFAGPNPAWRDRFQMAFDGKGVLLYGGQILTDLWRFDGTAWTPLPVPTPMARASADMTFDSRRKKVVFYGGTDNVDLFGDTWEWDGAAWARVTTAHSPGSLTNVVLVYDPARAVTVLFGGNDATGRTWEYDGTDWYDRTPTTGPLPIYGVGAFDPGLKKVVAWGNTMPFYSSAERVFAWSGTVWTDVTPASGPAARSSEPTLTTSELGAIMFGGSETNTSNYPDDVWVFTNGAWTQRVAPGPRAQAGLAHDTKHGRIVVFGGADSTGTDLSDTWVLTERDGWKLETGATPPSARVGIKGSVLAMAYDPSADNVVLFGGTDGSGDVADTWIWNGTSWSQRFPAHTPPAFAAQLAFDGEHVTLFCGASGTGPLETWQWNGADWIDRTPANAPLVRVAPALGYDPVHHVVVMFGGRLPSTTNTSDETWTWDGTSWAQQSPSTRPSTTSNSPLTWNPARARLELVGIDMDTWEWDGTDWQPIAAQDKPSARATSVTGTTLDGRATFSAFGATPYSGGTYFDELWELRWDSGAPTERCDGGDLDGDMHTRCMDPDCWSVCAPSCPPETTCDPGAPSCGDGVCEPNIESCRTCAGDCPCQPICGDTICDANETGCPGDCP